MADHQNNQAKTDRFQGRNRQFYNNTWRFQYPFTVTDITTRQKVSEETEDLP